MDVSILAKELKKRGFSKGLWVEKLSLRTVPSQIHNDILLVWITPNLQEKLPCFKSTKKQGMWVCKLMPPGVKNKCYIKIVPRNLLVLLVHRTPLHAHLTLAFVHSLNLGVMFLNRTPSQPPWVSEWVVQINQLCRDASAIKCTAVDKDQLMIGTRDAK